MQIVEENEVATTLPVALLGDPVIRSVATPVEDISGAQTQSFIDTLIQTCALENGMGIAAPQVSCSKRIFIIASRPNARYPYAPEMEPTAFLNPEITWRSKQTEKDWEGCLSLPGIRALVPRHNRIEVKFTSRSGEQIETAYDGFIARVFQHELDHLDGTVFIDRVESTQDIVMEKEWRRIIAGRKPQ